MERTDDDLETEAQPPRREQRPSDRPPALRWFFGFDGWRADEREEEFVLA